MTSISQSNRYFPHEINTRYYAVKLFKSGYSSSFVCRRYKISKSSLMRWSKRFDGTKKSLLDKSHRPLTPHPNAHTEEELKWIKDYLRRNPNISMSELYGKLRVDKGYSRHACSLFRVMRKMGYFVNKEKHVKYIPKDCYVGNDGQKFYQYTIIDEASREIFILNHLFILKKVTKKLQGLFSTK